VGVLQRDLSREEDSWSSPEEDGNLGGSDGDGDRPAFAVVNDGVDSNPPPRRRRGGGTTVPSSILQAEDAGPAEVPVDAPILPAVWMTAGTPLRSFITTHHTDPLYYSAISPFRTPAATMTTHTTTAADAAVASPAAESTPAGQRCSTVPPPVEGGGDGAQRLSCTYPHGHSADTVLRSSTVVSGRPALYFAWSRAGAHSLRLGCVGGASWA
jgi:hypothetical protein